MAHRYHARSHIGWRTLGDDTVAYNCSSQHISIWNASGSILWERIVRDGATLDELTDALVDAYEIDSATARDDAQSFIDTLTASGYLAGDVLGHTGYTTDGDGADVLLEIERLAIEQRIPYAVLLETTFACNERCIHCYMETRGAQMSTSQIVALLDALADAGTLFLTLTGGEFFTRTDAVELLRAAAARGFVLDILTNGTRITGSIAATIAALPVRRVQVSIYGSCADRHDAVTQRPGSFDETVRAIRALRAHGVRVECAMTLLRSSIDDLAATEALAGSLGCGFLASYVVAGRNSGATDTHALRITDAQLRAHLASPEVARTYRGRKPFAEHQHYMGVQDLAAAAPCYSGFNTCAIRPNGDVVPCNQMQYVVGNVLEQPFSEIWHDAPALARLRAITVRDLSTCSQCALLDRCTRCPGLALLEGGDLCAPSPEHCRIASMRATLEDHPA